MTKYAAGTNVPVDRSQAEIRKILLRYGADQFVSGEDIESGSAMIMFRMENRHIRFLLPLPNRDDYRYTPNQGTERSQTAWDNVWQQACRQRWRALVLCIKSKLESIESGIESFEEAFMAHVMLPDGSVVKDHALHAIAEAYETGKMPKLLGGVDGGHKN